MGVQVVVDDLEQHGYVDLEEHAGFMPSDVELEAMRKKLREIVASIKTKESLHTQRRATNLPINKMGRAFMHSIFNPAVMEMLTTALPDGQLLHGMSEIECPAHTGPQHLHRDHRFGESVALVVAISLDERPLGTEFDPGSHHDHESELTARGSMERDRMERAGRLTSMKGRFMVYDPFIMHRGYPSLNPAPNLTLILP